jgi:hypothetical protein
MSTKTRSWRRLSFDMWRAGFEAQQVIGLRLAKFMGGGAGCSRNDAHGFGKGERGARSPERDGKIDADR